MNKRFFMYVLVVLVVASFGCAATSGSASRVTVKPSTSQEIAVQGGAELQPDQSLLTVLAQIGPAPVAVAEVRPHDAYRSSQHGRGGYGSYNVFRAHASTFGYGRSYGYNVPVMADVDPNVTLGSVAQTELSRQLSQRGVNVILPATGPGAQDLDAAFMEASIGRDAFDPNATMDTARFLVMASYAITNERIEHRGFDGRLARGVISGLVGAIVPNSYQARRRAYEAERAVAQIQTQKQVRIIDGVMYVSLVEVSTRRVLWSGQGAASYELDEVSASNYAGLNSFRLSYPGGQALAQGLVLAALMNN